MPRWFNDKSNRRNPYGGWKFDPDGSWKHSSVIQFNNFIPNSRLQKEVQDRSGKCICCSLRFQSINHFHCTKCFHHTACINCKKLFSPSADSFLQFCEQCWKQARLEILSNEDFDSFFEIYDFLHPSSKLSDKKDEDDRHETNRDSDPVIA